MHTQKGIRKTVRNENKKRIQNDVYERIVKKMLSKKTLFAFLLVNQRQIQQFFCVCLVSLSFSLSAESRNEFNLNNVCVFPLLLHTLIHFRWRIRHVCVWVCENKLKCNCLNWKWRPKIWIFSLRRVTTQKEGNDIIITKIQLHFHSVSGVCVYRPNWITIYFSARFHSKWANVVWLWSHFAKQLLNFFMPLSVWYIYLLSIALLPFHIE